MRGKRLRMELRLTASCKARYQGRVCGSERVRRQGEAAKPARRDSRFAKITIAGGKSDWMEGFFDRPGPPLWQAIRTANG